MSFDFDRWLAETETIPQERIGECLRAVTTRYNTIKDAPKMMEARNTTARTYHETQQPELIEGVPVWGEPIADFAAYPTGFEVAHGGEVWVQTSADIAHGEPGVDPAWQPKPEPEPIEEEIA